MRSTQYLLLLVTLPFASMAHAATEASAARHAETHGVAVGLPAGGGPTVGGTYFLSKDRAVRLDVGLDINHHDATSTWLYGLSIDAGYRMYMWDHGPLAAFVQPGVFLAKAARAGDFADNLSVAFGGTVGAEYFFDPQLSISASTGLSMVFSNAFKDFQLHSGTTALLLNFYW